MLFLVVFSSHFIEPVNEITKGLDKVYSEVKSLRFSEKLGKQQRKDCVVSEGAARPSGWRVDIGADFSKLLRGQRNEENKAENFWLCNHTPVEFHNQILYLYQNGSM